MTLDQQYNELANYCNKLKIEVNYYSGELLSYKRKYEKLKIKTQKIKNINDHLSCELHNTKISFIFYQILSVLIYISLAVLIFLKSC